MTEISAANDGLLRMLVLNHLIGPVQADEIVRTLKTLDHVRTEPPRAPQRIVLDKELAGLRAA